MVSRRIQQTNRGQYTLVLPAGTIEAIGWGKHTEVEFHVSGKDRIELKKIGDNND